MAYRIIKTINCDTHNIHHTLPGTFADRVQATRVIRHLINVRDADGYLGGEYCYDIVNTATGRKVSYVYPRGPFVCDLREPWDADGRW